MPTWDWRALRSRALAEARRCRADEPEELAQEALLKAWRYRASCRDTESAGAWVAAIVRQEAARAARSPRRSETTTEPGDLEQLQAPDHLEVLPERLDVRRALAQLEEPDRRLLLLRYAADLTQPAAAAAIGVPEGTAKVRLHRLRLRMRDAMAAG